jgi:hypothetical protein
VAEFVRDHGDALPRAEHRQQRDAECQSAPPEQAAGRPGRVVGGRERHDVGRSRAERCGDPLDQRMQLGRLLGRDRALAVQPSDPRAQQDADGDRQQAQQQRFERECGASQPSPGDATAQQC